MVMGLVKGGVVAVVVAAVIWLMTQFHSKADAADFRAVEKQQTEDHSAVNELDRRLDRLTETIDKIAAKLGVTPTP